MTIMHLYVFQTCPGRPTGQAKFRRPAAPATTSSADPISRVPTCGKERWKCRRLTAVRSEVRVPTGVGSGGGSGRRPGREAAATPVTSGPPSDHSTVATSAANHHQTPFIHTAYPVGVDVTWRVRDPRRRLTEVARHVAGVAGQRKWRRWRRRHGPAPSLFGRAHVAQR